MFEQSASTVFGMYLVCKRTWYDDGLRVCLVVCVTLTCCFRYLEAIHVRFAGLLGVEAAGGGWMKNVLCAMRLL